MIPCATLKHVKRVAVLRRLLGLYLIEEESDSEGDGLTELLLHLVIDWEISGFPGLGGQDEELGQPL
jgi:hypothetical protein